MDIKYRNICIFLFILVIFLGLNSVSANDMDFNNDTGSLSDADNLNYETQNLNTVYDNDKNNDFSQDDIKSDDNLSDGYSNINNHQYDLKTKDIKKASRIPVSYNIIVTNNLVNNTTFDIALINAKDDTPIAGSTLKIKLPNSTVITTKTGTNAYSTVNLNLPAGNNTLTIDYEGNSTYYSYNYDLILEVFKSNVNMSVNIIKEDSGKANITLYLRDANTNKAIAGSTVTFALSDGRIIKKVTDKNACIFLSLDLNAGNNYLNISYDGNYKYNPADASTNLYIPTPKRIVQYTVTLNSLYVGNTSINIKLTDYNNSKVLSNMPLKFKVEGGKTYTVKTDKNGIANIKLDEKVSKHYANITYDGNNIYSNRTETINFTIIKRVSDINYTLVNNSNTYQIKAQLKDLVLNKTIPNENIIVTLNDNKKITKKTDKNGEITQNIATDIENQTYKLEYMGNSNITNVTKIITVTIPQPKIPVNLNVTVTSNIYNNDSLLLTLTSQKTNSKIRNVPVTVKIDNKEYNYTTDNNGQVKINPKLGVGTNNIQVKYNGSDIYQNFTAIVPINIIKRPTNMSSHITLSNKATLNLTLTDLITKNPLKNVDISVIHPQKTIQLTTDKNGKINQVLDLPAGKTRLIIKYLGNSSQQAVNSTTATFTIPGSTNNKTNTIISLNDSRVAVGDNVTLKAVVYDLDNNAVNTGYVNFKYNNTYLKDINTNNINIPVKNGVATITINTITHWRNSNIKVTASYLENAKYNPSLIKANMAVTYRTAIMTVSTSPTVTKMDEKITFTATLKDTRIINDGIVIFKVNGLTVKDDKNKTIFVEVKNNKASLEFTIPDGWSARAFKLTAVYSHRDYKRAENKTYFNLTKTQTHFNITSITAKKNNNLTIKARLLDSHNHNVLGVNTIAVKINGQTLQDNNNKSVFFNIINGTLDLSVKLPVKYAKLSSLNIMLVTGDRVAYLGSRFNTTIGVKD